MGKCQQGRIKDLVGCTFFQGLSRQCSQKFCLGVVVQLDISGQKTLNFDFFCKFKVKTQFYLVHNSRAGLRLSQALGTFLIFAEQKIFWGSIPSILTFVGPFFSFLGPFFLSFFAFVGPFIFVGPRHFAQSALCLIRPCITVQVWGCKCPIAPPLATLLVSCLHFDLGTPIFSHFRLSLVPSFLPCMPQG